MQKIEMRADHPDFSWDAVPDERFKDVLLPVAGGHKPLYDCTRIDLDEAIEVLQAKFTPAEQEEFKRLVYAENN